MPNRGAPGGLAGWDIPEGWVILLIALFFGPGRSGGVGYRIDVYSLTDANYRSGADYRGGLDWPSRLGYPRASVYPSA